MVQYFHITGKFEVPNLLKYVTLHGRNKLLKTRITMGAPKANLNLVANSLDSRTPIITINPRKSFKSYYHVSLSSKIIQCG